MRKLIPEEIANSAMLRKGKGCSECLHTGFAGRTAITELLPVDEVFRDAVLEKLPTRTLQKVAIDQGMETMWQCGLRKVETGQTTIEEIMRVISVDQL